MTELQQQQPPRHQPRLEALKLLQRTTVYCSNCNKKLRYSSFKSHPCYARAVKQHGSYLARLHVKRLQRPMGM